jgi:hypothetical protein
LDAKWSYLRYGGQIKIKRTPELSQAALEKLSKPLTKIKIKSRRLIFKKLVEC